MGGKEVYDVANMDEIRIDKSFDVLWMIGMVCLIILVVFQKGGSRYAWLQLCDQLWLTKYYYNCCASCIITISCIHCWYVERDKSYVRRGAKDLFETQKEEYGISKGELGLHDEPFMRIGTKCIE